jgi:hypothetical protein
MIDGHQGSTGRLGCSLDLALTARVSKLMTVAPQRRSWAGLGGASRRNRLVPTRADHAHVRGLVPGAMLGVSLSLTTGLGTNRSLSPLDLAPARPVHLYSCSTIR